MPEHDLCRDAGENGCEPLAAVAVTGQWLCSFAVVGWWGGGVVAVGVSHQPAFARRLSRCLQEKAGKQGASRMKSAMQAGADAPACMLQDAAMARYGQCLKGLAPL